MQNILEFRSDMEDSLSWRVNEFLALKNLLRSDNSIPIVKTLIVMLYAHFEGFFKDCLECYIKYINSTELTLSNFSDTIITASLSREYSSFEDSNRKCKELTLSLIHICHAYKLIRELNEELQSKGYLVVARKVPKAFWETKFYGYNQPNQTA